MIEPSDDVAPPRPGAATDAVTVSFSDLAADVHGVFRLALDPDGAGSAFAVLFHGGAPVAAQAAGELEAEGGDWSRLAAGPLRMEVEVPLERWSLRWDGDGAAVELVLEAASAPAEVPEVGGMAGYEQLCRVHGHAVVAGRRIALDGPGQRGHSWGTPDWRRLDLTRSVAVWLGEGDGVALAGARPAGADGHEEEVVWGALMTAGEPEPVSDPRLSTTYDDEGRQRRASLELWVGEDAPYPERAAGEAHCGSTLDLGPLRLDVAFFTWHADGRAGVGRYDVLRRA